MNRRERRKKNNTQRMTQMYTVGFTVKSTHTHTHTRIHAQMFSISSCDSCCQSAWPPVSDARTHRFWHFSVATSISTRVMYAHLLPPSFISCSIIISIIYQFVYISPAISLSISVHVIAPIQRFAIVQYNPVIKSHHQFQVFNYCFVLFFVQIHRRFAVSFAFCIIFMFMSLCNATIVRDGQNGKINTFRWMQQVLDVVQRSE